MEEKPIIKLNLTLTYKLFELIGWLSFIAIWVLTITSYSSLPDTIPIHFNGAGQADGFGGKATILTLPIIATILFVGLTLLNQVPHIFNYPTPVTEGNVIGQYTNATRLIRYLKGIIVIVFGLIVIKTIQHTNGKADGLGLGFLPLTTLLFLIPLVYFVLKSFKSKQ